MERSEALAKHLGCDPEDFDANKNDDNLFCYGSDEYLVLTDEEADAYAATQIREDAWAFRASFILSECGLPDELKGAIEAFQADKCESAQPAIEALIEKCCGFPKFVEAAISADGRGHFLAGYDGEEREEGEYFIYRR